MNPTISIIVPVYNTAEYLRECLDSIKVQTFVDWECICINDGSTDASAQILDTYPKSDNRFVVKHKANGGVTSARKMGTELSRGEFLVFVDSDDILPTDSLATLLNIQEKYAADLVRANWSWFSGNTLTSHIPPELSEKVVPGINLLPAFYRYGSMWGTLYSRQLFSGPCPFPPEKVILGEDSLTLFEVMLRTERAVFVKDIVYYYRDNPESVSHYLYSNPDKELAADTDYTLALIDFINKHRKKKLTSLKFLVIDNLYNKTVKTSYFRQHRPFLLRIYFRFFVFSLPVQIMAWKSNWKKWVRLWLFARRFFVNFT